MGNTPADKMADSTQIWTPVEPSRVSLPGHPSVKVHSTTHREADCYEIPLQQNLNYQVHLLHRHQQIQHPNILILIDARKKIKSLLECGNRQVIEIYTEKITCRLDELKLNANEASFVMFETIKGVIGLCGFAGNHFVVEDKMVGFDEQGRVKVWLDENFGNQEIQQASLARNEEQTVKSIIKIFSSRIGSLLNSQKITTFSKLLSEAERLIKYINKIQIKQQILNKLKQIELPVNTSEKKLASSRSETSVGDSKVFDQTNQVKGRPSVEGFIIRNKQNIAEPATGEMKYSLKEGAMSSRIVPKAINGPVKISIVESKMACSPKMMNFRPKSEIYSQPTPFTLTNNTNSCLVQSNHLNSVRSPAKIVINYQKNNDYSIRNPFTQESLIPYNQKKPQNPNLSLQAGTIPHQVVFPPKSPRVSLQRNLNHRCSEIVQQTEQSELTIKQELSPKQFQRKERRETKLSQFNKENFLSSMRQVASKQTIKSHPSATSIL